MSTEIGDRIHARMVALGLKQADLIRATGAGRATVSNWVNGRNKPTGEFPAKLSKILQVDTDWLLTGVTTEQRNEVAADKDMLFRVQMAMRLGLDPARPVDIDEFTDHEGSIDADFIDAYNATMAEIHTYKLSSVNPPVKDTSTISLPKSMLPVVSWVSAGDWAATMPVTIDDAVEWLPRPSHLSEKAFGLIVRGRSMWPEFRPGDIILVEPDVCVLSLKDGDLVVVMTENETEATFKQLVIGDTHKDMYLKPLNPDWPEQRMVPMGTAVLIGVVDSKFVKYR